VKKLPFLLLLLAEFSIAALPPSLSWRPLGAQDGLSLFEGEAEPSRVLAMKGVGVLDVPAWKLVAILLDLKRSPEWVDSLVEAKMLQRVGPFSYLEYNHIGTPFILKDREFVSRVDMKVSPAQRRFTLQYVATDEIDPKPTSRVRGEVLHGLFQFEVTGANQTTISMELLCDPKGSVPKWIVNLFQKAWPRDTFEGLRAQAAKSDLQVPEDFANVVDAVRRL